MLIYDSIGCMPTAHYWHIGPYLLSDRLMSDYEVTLVNDNSEFAFWEEYFELLLTKAASSVRFLALDRIKEG